MTIHSKMARAIDTSKMERVRETAIEMIVEQGYGGASIAMIAHKAEVADGYLYRFYKGKQELVLDLLHTLVDVIVDQLETLLKNCSQVSDVIRILTTSFFQMAEQQPTHIKFLDVLMHDYNFRIKAQQRTQIFSLCHRIKEIGVKTGEVSESMNEDDIYLLGVVLPIQFLNLRIKTFFDREEWNLKDREHIIMIILKSLKE